MRKLITSFIAVTVSTLLLAGCGSSSTSNETGNLDEGKTIIVGATSVPHAEILSTVVDDLADQGITLQIKEFSDYTLLNTSLQDGSISANFFQHTPYLDEYNSNSGSNLVSVGGVHIEPMGVYSEKISSLDELEEGAKVGLPNDATNEGRALLILQEQGLITLHDEAGLLATPNDIIDNPKNLQFVELAAAQLPRTLSEVSISIINTNYALEAGLNPLEDAIAIESVNSPYVNVLVTTEDKANSEEIKALYDVLTTDEVREFIEEYYQGAIVPAFE